MTSVGDPVARNNRAATIVGFTSQTGGTGRTSAVANVAWILASGGRRVLVADWSADAPRVDEFLSPFLVDIMQPGDVLGEGPARELFVGGVVRRYRLPTTTHCIDVLGPADADVRSRMEWSGSEGSGEIAATREALRSAGYDIVLVDSLVDPSDVSTIRTALLHDVVALCFLPRRKAVERAAELADRIRDRAPVRMRIVAVATHFDDRDESRARQTRSLIEEAFEELLTVSAEPRDRDLSGELVEIPYQPYDAHDEVLAVLIDEPDRTSTLLAAYERLATALMHEVAVLQPAPPDVRERYRRGLGIGLEEAEPETIYLAHAPRDRPWADWIKGLLEAVGVRVRKLSRGTELRELSGPVRVVIIASPNLAVSSTVLDIGRLLDDIRAGRQDEVAVVRVSVEDHNADEFFMPGSLIDITRCSEEAARTELLSHLGIIIHAIGEQAPAHNFPRSSRRRQGMNSLPLRNPAFAGRDEELGAMRDHFIGGDGIRRWTLAGAAGIGKSEIAREYAHRFGFDYDVVWWVSARDRQSVRASLARLAAELKVGAAGDAAAAALVALSRRSRATRWLLVYDNADDVGVVDGLVPGGGSGDIIFTTRRAAASGSAAEAQVTALAPEDGVALVRSAVIGLSTKDAADVANAVQHLPLGLRLASAWVRAAADRLRQRGSTVSESAGWAAAEFRERIKQVSTEQVDGLASSSVQPSLSKVVTVLIETLQQDKLGRLALRLSEFCAFLSPDGVTLRLLRSVPMQAELVAASGADGEALARDAFEFDPVLRRAANSGLCDVGWGSSASLSMHSVVQVLLRELMSLEDRRGRQARVLRGLAAVAPSDSEGDDPGHVRDFAELQRHLVPSGALDSATRAVRRWLVDQVWYLYMQGDASAWQSAVDLAERALERWQIVGGDADLRMRLTFNLANLQRALGRYARALELDEAVLLQQRRDLGLIQLRTLRTARGKGGDLRGLGRFDEALAEDQTAWQGFREALGEDHPETLRATNNLALSYFLTGDVRAALTLEQRIRARRLLLFGPEHPLVWWSVCNIGTYLRELGSLDEAVATLQEALIRIREMRSLNHPDELRVRRSLAATLRRQGRAAAAKERNGETLQAYRELFGDDHPDTRACTLSLAADHHAVGDSETAVELATRCLAGYISGLGPDHPFTSVCYVDLGIFLRAAGRFEAASQAGGRGLRNLRIQLGETHPWTLAAAIDHARTLVTCGDADAVEGLVVTYDDCRESLGRDHPYTSAAARNLRDLKALRRTPEFRSPDDGSIRPADLEIEVPQT